MSWAEEDWTVGLSGRVLQKVKELQVHQERLSRENKQKQLLLDNIQTSLEKQTAKYEEVRGELQSLQRELQSVREEAKASVTSRERLAQELQTKHAQVCSLEGQLDSARTLCSKLTQEVKRLEAELEKLQNSTRTPDTTLFSTPCWTTASPWGDGGSRPEERTGQQDEGTSRGLHSRRLQFSDTPTSSIPRQQHKSHRHPSDQSETFSTPLTVFPWQRDEARPSARRRIPPSPLSPCGDQGSAKQGGNKEEQDHRTESGEIWSRVSALENELLTKEEKLKSIQNEVVHSKKELAIKENSLQKARDELSLAHTRVAQESERASEIEQRLKQLQEELRCQRQNAESSRMQYQQRTKEMEKQHQRDLMELQKEKQCMEKQHQQEVNKLNQELQQARTLHNALQAQADKLSLQKQALDKELETLKEKLKWTEEQLKESQKMESQTQAKLAEAVREAEGVALSLEQSRKKERALEEEGRRLVEEQADTLRLLKELQEQKSATAQPPQPVQFCPVGQSFSPQSSLSHHHPRQSSHSKRPSTARPEQRREEDEIIHEKRSDFRAPYPSDREPGEGIDSEHITVLTSSDPEHLQRAEHRRMSNEECNKSINEEMECGTSHMPMNMSMDAVGVIDPENSQNRKAETISSEDLKKENAMLRSELQDAREELQKRLDDLEAQRRAETEARTRLKQLSRKHTSQALDREEKVKEWKAQLENERAEAEKLRRTISALETELKRGREARDRTAQEEEKIKAQEDRESEMIELSIQLKKQLAEVKAQLALEREERQREEESRSQVINTEADQNKELHLKVAELKAELEELKEKRKDSQEEEKLSEANSPVTYLTLRDDELNSNVVSCEGKLLPSPERHLIFCESTNRRNMLVSQVTADIIQVVGDDAQTGNVTSDPVDTRKENVRGSSSSALQKGELDVSDLAKEVEYLQKENAKEKERANQCQVKLEVLHGQVTRQTQQLTTAFEKQSQHISGLLAELQEKENALLSQERELQQCKKELDTLKSVNKEMKIKDADHARREEEYKDENLAENSDLQPKQELESAVICHTPSSCAADDLNVGGDARQPEMETCDAKTLPHMNTKEHKAVRPECVDLTQNNHDSACMTTEGQHNQNAETTAMLAELFTLRQENQLLKQRIKCQAATENSTTLQTHGETQEDSVRQSQNSEYASESQSVQDDTVTTGVGSHVKQSEDEWLDLKIKDDKVTVSAGDSKALSQALIDNLQRQVGALQMKVRALSEETQQQAKELTVWRLASQPAPTFDQSIINKDDQFETQKGICAVQQLQSDQQQMNNVTQSEAQTQDNVTVIRGDELYLHCSSNKLQGRMLFSGLQNNNIPEPKSLRPSQKMALLLEYDQNAANIDQESEKENQKSCLSDTGSPLHKLKTETELIQLSSKKMAQQPAVEVLGPKPTKANECYTRKPEARSNSLVETKTVKTAMSSSVIDVKTEVKSVSSQTEESLYLCGAPTVSVNTQTEEEEDVKDTVDHPPVCPVPLSEGAESRDKLFSGSFPIPTDPVHLAERIRRNRTQLSAAFDDTEYEPYGLPEVVKKGFADIPSGPSCPYIVRRGLLGTTVVPVSQKAVKEQEETD
ncbi:uncharacterized protein KZ484_010203 isoform 2-T2 [Pholidichthys leucotaenia]